MIMAKESRGKAPETEAKKSSLVTAAPVAEVKEPETKKIEPKKEETIKEEPKKAVDASAKKVVGKPKKIAKEKEKSSMVPEVFVQFEDNGVQEANMAELVAKIKAEYVADGHRESSIKALQVYVKPQEWAAYYVINNKITGRMDLF